MGIDPVTHEPLHKETENSQSHAADNFPDQSEKIHQLEANGNINEENSSSSPTDHQNSSSDESNLCDRNLYENDHPLISCLFRDEPPDQIQVPWEFPPTHLENFNSFWGDENCSWLLDCQDLGIHDFDFDCLNDMEMNKSPNSLEMGSNQY